MSTGSEPIIPRMSGIDSENVLLATDILVDDSKIGEEVVVACGGFVGCETAIYLSQKGKKLTIVEMK
ncbi:FAD-dependent oxidoreductase, partial [Clostridium sp. HCS.1]|uniref:FAD-dependent oxidoreductase n=1 Tax=Clostridium sp. HCS.1 TaxID=3238594 RepID=UPI003A101C9A